MISTLPQSTLASTNSTPSPAAPAVDPLTATATAVLDSHHDDGSGMCAGCHTNYGQLKPAPCTQAGWAATVTDYRSSSR